MLFIIIGVIVNDFYFMIDQSKDFKVRQAEF